MTLRQREHPEARAELRAAALWYERKERGVGQRFLDRTRQARRSIAASPEAWHRYPGWDRDDLVVRVRSVAKHPYDIVYFTTAREIVIVAYAHESREPGYWRNRVDE
ncbi:MAG: type II toxin-antitoxin system RelE/ParE family toxin [Propionibacteriaceae bacterium]|nr:type II toxin-antitoxin system RelE/ParE family toxin [Propionibacteriaceae bacterium]